VDIQQAGIIEPIYDYARLNKKSRRTMLAWCHENNHGVRHSNDNLLHLFDPHGRPSGHRALSCAATETRGKSLLH
jgi:hypothetical protein